MNWFGWQIVLLSTLWVQAKSHNSVSTGLPPENSLCRVPAPAAHPKGVMWLSSACPELHRHWLSAHHHHHPATSAGGNVLRPNLTTTGAHCLPSRGAVWDFSAGQVISLLHDLAIHHGLIQIKQGVHRRDVVWIVGQATALTKWL